MSKYLVIYEPGEHNWSAFSPDVPGCVATGKSREETERNFREALTLHLELLAEDGDDIPQPTGLVAGYVVVLCRRPPSSSCARLSPLCRRERNCRSPLTRRKRPGPHSRAILPSAALASRRLL